MKVKTYKAQPKHIIRRVQLEPFIPSGVSTFSAGKYGEHETVLLNKNIINSHSHSYIPYKMTALTFTKSTEKRLVHVNSANETPHLMNVSVRKYSDGSEIVNGEVPGLVEFPNGLKDKTVPSMIKVHPRIAAQYSALNQMHKDEFGTDLRVSGCMRTFAAQQYCRQRQTDLKNAGKKWSSSADPGTSVHGFALAVDFDQSWTGSSSSNTPGYKWLESKGPLVGMVNPDWAKKKGPSFEPWHWEFVIFDSPFTLTPIPDPEPLPVVTQSDTNYYKHPFLIPSSSTALLSRNDDLSPPLDLLSAIRICTTHVSSKIFPGLSEILTPEIQHHVYNVYAKRESAYQWNALNPKSDAQGFFQLTPITRKTLFGSEDYLTFLDSKAGREFAEKFQLSAPSADAVNWLDKYAHNSPDIIISNSVDNYWWSQIPAMACFAVLTWAAIAKDWRWDGVKWNSVASPLNSSVSDSYYQLIQKYLDSPGTGLAVLWTLYATSGVNAMFRSTSTPLGLATHQSRLGLAAADYMTSRYDTPQKYA